MLEDLERETVDFIDNYDGKYREPLVLPSKFPNLLVNGSDGIAVGMATEIPPHNLREVCDALIRLIDDPDVTIEELIEIIPGPRFSHRRHHLRPAGHLDGYRTGRGKITLRARANIDEEGKDQIVINEVPYQQTRNRLHEAIGELIKDERIKGVSDIRDESSARGGEPVPHRRRSQTRRRSGTGPQPALSVFAVAEDRQHHHAGPGGRSAADC